MAKFKVTLEYNATVSYEIEAYDRDTAIEEAAGQLEFDIPSPGNLNWYTPSVFKADKDPIAT